MNINFSKLFDELFPLNRSLLGDGYNKSLKILSKYINFKKIKYKSGTKIFDWVVPLEWVVKKAYIEFKGKRILDYKNSNLHLVNYSIKINKILKKEELENKIYSIPSAPKLIPYVTSYYKKNWGFCASHHFKKKLKNGFYKCVIDSYFKKGEIVNGLAEIKGETKKINLVSSYLCHPSMANNELSGPLVMVGLFNLIKKWKNKNFTYNFLINPETIGSLCFLKSHSFNLKKNLNAGLVLTCLGGPQSKLTYKLSKSGNSTLDKIFKMFKKEFINIVEFDPASGSDERQYNSPGYNFAVGNISRTSYSNFKVYHTSGDNKEFMSISKIQDSIKKLETILKLHDLSLPLKRFMPFGELMLGKRNLYPNINSHLNRNKSNDNNSTSREELSIILNILSYSDGKKNILDIIEERKLNKFSAFKVLEKCIELKLLYFIK